MDEGIAKLGSLQRDRRSAERLVEEARILAPRVSPQVFDTLQAKFAALAETDGAQHDALLATRARLIQYERAADAFAAKEVELQRWHETQCEAILSELLKASHALAAALGGFVDSLTNRKAKMKQEQDALVAKQEELKAKVNERARDGLPFEIEARNLTDRKAEIEERRTLLNRVDAEAAEALAMLVAKLDERALSLLASSSAAAELHAAFSHQRLEALPAIASFVNEHVLTMLPKPPPPREREPRTDRPFKRARRSVTDAVWSTVSSGVSFISSSVGHGAGVDIV